MRYIQGDPKCVSCTKACTKQCSRSKFFIPVNRWCAIKSNHGYFVIDCPKYEYDGDKTIRAEDMDTEGMLALIEAFLELVKDDYIHSTTGGRRSIERDLRSSRCQKLLAMLDVEEIIRELKKQVIEYDERRPWAKLP